MLAGSKNLLSLDMGSVKTRIFSECSMLECNKDLELYYLDSFKIVHEKWTLYKSLLFKLHFFGVFLTIKRVK